MSILNLLRQSRIQILIIVTLTFFAYSSIFANGFVIDDFDFIVNWSSSHQFDLFNLIKGDQPYGHGGVYRPVRSVLYSLYYQVFSTNPTYYHLHSILVHLISTILVYLIASRLWLIANRKTKGINDLRSATSYLPFTTALLFGVHPIHTESITYIAASMEITGVVFFLASFYLYIAQRKISSLIFAFLAFFTYEMTLTLPFVIFVFDFCIKKLKVRKLALVKLYLPYFLGVIAYFLLKLSLTHNLNRGEYLGGSIYFTVLVMFKAFVKYLQLLIWPVNLSLVHILPGGIPTLGGVDIKKELLDSQSIFDPVILLGLALLAGLVFLSFRLIRAHPLISFACFWFLITLIPASQIIPLQVVMGEKYLYIPSIGYCLLVALLIQKLKVKIQKCKSKVKSILNFFRAQLASFAYFLLALLTFTFCILTFNRNLNWRDSETIWKDATLKASGSASVHYNLANVYQSASKLQEARDEYREALKVDPLYHPALSNLGFICLNLGDRLEAKKYFLKAIEVKDFYPMHYGLGILYSQEGQLDWALEEYKKALDLNPNFVEAKQAVELINYQKSRIKSLQR